MGVGQRDSGLTDALIKLDSVTLSLVPATLPITWSKLQGSSRVLGEGVLVNLSANCLR